MQTNPNDIEMYDVKDLQKWNCIIEPTQLGLKSYGGVYLGDIDCAQDPYLLNQLQIGALLSVIDEPEIHLPSELCYIIREIIAVPDSLDQSLLSYLPRCSEFIERHRKHTNVMVHCFAGISRSASCVIAYLMEKFEWGYDRAYQMVKAVRKQVKPNDGFKKQLQEYELILRERRLSKYQIQKRIPTQSSEPQQMVTPTQNPLFKTVPQISNQAESTLLFQQNQSNKYGIQEYQKEFSSQNQPQFSYQKQQPSQHQQMHQKNKSSLTNGNFDNNGILKVINNQLMPKMSIEEEIAKRQKSLMELQQRFQDLQKNNNRLFSQNVNGNIKMNTNQNGNISYIGYEGRNTANPNFINYSMSNNRSMTRERVRRINPTNQSYQEMIPKNYVESNNFQPAQNQLKKVIKMNTFGLMQPFNSIGQQVRNS